MASDLMAREHGTPHEGGASREGVPAARLVGLTLWNLGVRQVFGVVGSGNFVATAALTGAGARYVAARHEGGAITMADSYSRVSGEVAVCSVHQGPGLTNALTGLVDAVKSRTPLLVIAGQTSAGATRSNFYVDQVGLVESCGAISEQLFRAETVVEDTVRAYRRALTERLPVVLHMPLDVQAALVPGPAPAVSIPERAVVHPSPDAVRNLAEVLRRAHRPLILAGRGAVLAGARAALEELGGRLGALFANTAVAKGFFEGNPWTLGIAGGFSTDEAARLMGEADVVVGFGTSYTTWTTRQDTMFARGTVVVQVDSQPSALGLSPRVDVEVLGDCAATAQALLAELGALPDGSAQWRTDAVARRITAQREVTPAQREAEAAPGTVHPKSLSLALEAMLPQERTVVIDGGHFLGWPATSWSVPDPQGFVFSSAGFQSIGLGLAAAAGAHLARPDRMTVLGVGDGGFLMSVAELETLVRLQLPVLVVVYNDAAYSAEVHHFGPEGAGMDLVQFPATDIAALARGVGAHGVTVREMPDLDVVACWVADPRGPMIVDAKVDPTVVGYWAAQDFQGH